ncbi:MAG: hypothetical protein GX819_00245 [Clostridiaceae bacterium]|nr:hypothetical protein [Clostridiaceae bacterium]
MSKEFYRDVLEFDVVSETEEEGGIRIAMIEKGNCVVELVQLPQYDSYVDGFFNHLAMEVENIEEARAWLEDKGIAFEMEESAISNVYNGVKYLMFRGPDGERLEIDQML